MSRGERPNQLAILGQIWCTFEEDKTGLHKSRYVYFDMNQTILLS